MELQLALTNTANKYLKGAADNTTRNRAWLMYFVKEGRVLYNQGGPITTWNVRAREPGSQNHNSGIGVTFIQPNLFEQLTVPIAGIISASALDMKIKMLQEAEGGALTIVNLYGDALESTTGAAAHRLSREFYLQNTGDDTRLMGINTPMIPDGSATVNDLVILPSSSATYGGKSVRPGALGGTWDTNLAAAKRPSNLLSNDWPLGSGSPEYDYLSPRMLNSACPRWGSGANDWAGNCQHMLRRAKNWTKNLSGASHSPSVALLSQDYLDDFQDNLTIKERLTISDYGKALGFQDDVYNYNGLLVMADYDCPAGTGFCLNAGEMSLFTIHPNLFFTKGPDLNNTALAYEMFTGMYGNLRFNPKYVTKMASYP